MVEQETRPVGLKDPFQLLVEGNDPRNFFERFIAHLAIPGVQVQNFGGVTELRSFLEGFVVTPGFGRVRSIGIVRDAERRVDQGGQVEGQPPPAVSAFHSVRSSLQSVRLPVPDRLTEQAGTRPSVSVFVLPGDENDGMLETLLCKTFAGTDVDRCIDGFFRCAEEAGSPIRRRDKARARVYLTTKPEPHVSVGVAAQKRYWDFDHDAFDGVRRFLRSLARDRPAAQR